MGEGTGVHVSEVDYIIPGVDRPMAELPKAPATEVDKAVARLIAAEVRTASCLQIGIGGMPNAVCSLLAESPVVGPGHPHRDDDRRDRRPLPGRSDHRGDESS